MGALDQLRFETTANGKTNIPECRHGGDPEEYRGLKAMSTYHAIADGAKYPALLLTHGFNDPRVPVWMTTKTSARFLAANRRRTSSSRASRWTRATASARPPTAPGRERRYLAFLEE